MNLIVCLDKSKGMLFGGKRQSRDSVLCEKILEIAKGDRLFMSNFSAKLFENTESIIIDDNFLSTAQQGDYAFAECEINSLDNVEKLIIFQWNRDYPGDVYFDFNIQEYGFKKIKKEDFQGNSHKKITMEIYERGQE